ncbi:glycosyltransferase [Lachnospiraceae bacterium WCA-9-b2]|uniref:Glycosyltransferase n=1 Tax=Sporofaciens musculi TaxID=2681861 RepID=A0A7X3MEB9_9FIRM|nr:glycosyltransferase [Sporofaciens musculi]
MKRLVIIGGSLSRGGAERVMIYLADYMVKHGIATKIITSKRNDNEYELPSGVQRICLSENTSSNSKIDILNQIKNLQKYIKKNNIDTVLIIGVPTCLYAIPGCIKTGATIFVSERNDPTHFAGKKIVKYISRKLMEKADGYIFQTEDAKKFYEKRLNGRGTVIFNPLLNEKLPDVYIGKREKNIVSVGRLDSQKNQKILIEAFTRIAKEYSDYNLIFYGEGPLRDTLKRQIENYSMQKRIFWKEMYLICLII